MTIKFFLGDKEVSNDEFQAAREKELKAGNGIKSTEELDGMPAYILDNGTVIRGNGRGGFNRVEDGKLAEQWMPGTMNEWIQDSPTEIGKAEFFFRV